VQLQRGCMKSSIVPLISVFSSFVGLIDEGEDLTDLRVDDLAHIIGLMLLREVHSKTLHRFFRVRKNNGFCNQYMYRIFSPLCGILSPVCGIPSPLCGILSPLCWIPSPLCGISYPLCGIPSPLCGILSPVCGILSPLCGILSPVCGIPSPLCGILSPVHGTFSPL
jgi:hypothetical protein